MTFFQFEHGAMNDNFTNTTQKLGSISIEGHVRQVITYVINVYIQYPSSTQNAYSMWELISRKRVQPGLSVSRSFRNCSSPIFCLITVYTGFIFRHDDQRERSSRDGFLYKLPIYVSRWCSRELATVFVPCVVIRVLITVLRCPAGSRWPPEFQFRNGSRLRCWRNV